MFTANSAALLCFVFIFVNNLSAADVITTNESFILLENSTVSTTTNQQLFKNQTVESSIQVLKTTEVPNTSSTTTEVTTSTSTEITTESTTHSVPLLLDKLPRENTLEIIKKLTNNTR